MDGPVVNVLVEDELIKEFRRFKRIDVDALALSPDLRFVETCRGSYCFEIVGRDPANRFRNEQTQIAQPRSRILLRAASVTRTSLTSLLPTYEVQYEVSDRVSGEVLATATERVMTWGVFEPYMDVLSLREGSHVSACGYALPTPHEFRPNVIPSAAREPYVAADYGLIRSIQRE